jgi:glycine cleavage system aminomethyltransferase T
LTNATYNPLDTQNSLPDFSATVCIVSDVGVIDVSAASVVSVFVPDDIAALDICIVSAMTDTTVWTTTKTHMYF